MGQTGARPDVKNGETTCKPDSVPTRGCREPGKAAIICLGRRSPVASRGLPGSHREAGHLCSPIWPCSEGGLPCPSGRPERRWALTPPFHPYRPAGRRFVFCGTFRRVTPPGCYPAFRPVESGLSSLLCPAGRGARLPGRLSSVLHTPVDACVCQRIGPGVVLSSHVPHADPLQADQALSSLLPEET